MIIRPFYPEKFNFGKKLKIVIYDFFLIPFWILSGVGKYGVGSEWSFGIFDPSKFVPLSGFINGLFHSF
jgi:hypothetical protein